MRGSTPPVIHRGAIATTARIALAVLGGYVTVSLWTFFLGRIIPGDRAGAGFTATMLSFLLYAGCFVWVFGAKRLGRTAMIMAALAALAALGIALT
jgi:hypothetical protein